MESKDILAESKSNEALNAKLNIFNKEYTTFYNKCLNCFFSLNNQFSFFFFETSKY